MLQFDERDLFRFYDAIKRARRILVLQPRATAMDGDSVGSGVALDIALRSIGKDVVHYAPDEVPVAYRFLKGIEHVTREFPDLDTIDVTLVCDEGDLFAQSGLPAELVRDLQTRTTLVNIDHHPSNDGYGTINLVVPGASSTTQMITAMFRMFGIRITADIATSLLAGLYFDTGSLMHDNTTADTYRTASWLVGRGADIESIVRHMYRSKTIGRLKLWGRIFERARVSADGVASSCILMEDFAELGASPAELEGAVNYLNSIPGIRFSLLLSQRGTVCKASFRTPHDDVNVSDIASIFGGGGHQKAAAFALEGYRIVLDGDRRRIEPIAP